MSECICAASERAYGARNNREARFENKIMIYFSLMVIPRIYVLKYEPKIKKDYLMDVPDKLVSLRILI